MPIKPRSTKAIQQEINRRLERLYQALTNVLIYAGEEVIKYARNPNRRRYKDRTGNLTSSIGYVVLRDGKVMRESDFATVKGDGTSKGKLTGSKSGRDFLKSLISEHNNGLVLIVVAGMPYAAYVEAMGLDVLDSAEIKAEDIVKRLLSKLKF